MIYIIFIIQLIFSLMILIIMNYLMKNYIFTLNLAKNGLKKLKSSYSNNPIIKNSINNYIKEINECLTNIHKQNQKQSQKEKQVNQNTSEK